MSVNETTPIPGPPPLPILGNLLDLDRENTVQSWVDLAGTYGPIYKLRLGGADRIFVTGPELVDELCSRKDFVKVPVGLVRSQKELTPEGLFTADYGQESWGVAHRVLVPAFGHLSVRNMFAEMHDMITQMILKWARFGEEDPIDVSSDFTRLTLDTIALCAMGMRFNSFYKESLHPFVKAMNDTFAESQQRSIRPAWLSSLMWRANAQFSESDKLMHEIAAAVIAKRRNNASDKKDLVNAMLHGRDTVTGDQLSDQTIMDNMITFLIAGHETTSGLLAFVFGLLMLNPDSYAKLRGEIDEVLGTGPMTPEHLTRLPYTKACLRESLRLYPPAAGFSLSPLGKSPIVLGGKWLIKPQDSCIVLLPKLHRDPEVFGDDAETFRPERMLDENLKKLPPNCFKPFGNGDRACIGNEFAMQEALMATAMLIQKFDFRLVDPHWEMTVKQTATLKPRNLFLYAKLRRGIDPLFLQRELFHGSGVGLSTATLHKQAETSKQLHVDAKLQEMLILFGSNTGTCELLAETLSLKARQKGYRCKVVSLNETGNEIPTDRPVIIISSSHYEGQAPDNATRFMAWLASLDKDSLSGVNFAVFGCGNREWKNTYQAIPTRIYATMEQCGAHPIAVRGVVDASEGNIVTEFEQWQEDHLWPGIAKVYGVRESSLSSSLERTTDQPLFIDENANPSDLLSPQRLSVTVKEVNRLTAGEPRPKFHLVVDLPPGCQYHVGDYLDVYPQNSKGDIERLLHVLKSRGFDEDYSLVTTLCSQHELNQPATVKQLQIVSMNCTEPRHRKILENLSLEFADAQSIRRPSILHLLEKYPTISLSLEQLSTMLPLLRPRPYSISSSPLEAPETCELIWSLIVYEEPPITDELGDKSVTSTSGLASNYLASLTAGDTLSCSIRAGNSRFRPPTDLTTPLIMICAGAGIAPFVGFIAHRAQQARRQKLLYSQLGPALLFVGCRSRDQVPYTLDSKFSKVVNVRYAYSQQRNDADFSGYVQDRVWADRGDLVQLWDSGARVFVCGSQAVSLGVKEVVRNIYTEVASARCGAGTEADLDAWWKEILRERYTVEVF